MRKGVKVYFAILYNFIRKVYFAILFLKVEKVDKIEIK
jgi:hypothetical protein